MFTLVLDRFRSFGERQSATIRPLTILVGENNTGKSSFLAATRYMIQWLNGAQPPSFNTPPYFLGSFDNISHYRGGKYGRATSFTLGVEMTRRQGPLRNAARSAELSLEFQAHGYEPSPHGVYLSADDNFFNVAGNSEHSQIDFSINGVSASIQRTPADYMPMELLGRQSRYFREVFNELRTYESRPTAKSRPLESAFRNMEMALRQLSSDVPRQVRASSPVRTEPERTYDPTRAPQIGDPNRAIFDLVQYLSQEDSNGQIIKAITSFGIRAGLFSNMRVKRLGSADADPFRIMVNASGRQANIADVGYGVSQVLPIVYELHRLRRQQAYLLQQPEVHLHPRAQAQLGSEVASVVAANRGYVIVETHSDYFVDRVRSEVRRGTLHPSNVSILFFQLDGFNSKIDNLELDEDGNYSSIPTKFREFFMREALVNLGLE